MGLLTALVTLPLAPVRGTVWLAEQLAAEAARQLDGEAATRRELEALQLDYELGRVDEEEFERREDELLERLLRFQEQANADRGGVADGNDG